MHTIKALKSITPKALKVPKYNFAKLSGVKTSSPKGRGKAVKKF